MKHDATRCQCVTEFNENTIRLMFKTEYFTYEKRLVLMRVVFAVAMLAVGMFAGFPIPGQAFCLLVGVWLIVALDFPSKIRAEGVIQQRGGAVSQVHLTFTESEIEVEKRQRISYKKVDRLAEETGYFIIFENRQSAVMVQKSGLDGMTPDEFKAFIEEKTEKTFQRNVNFFSMNLKDILGTFTSVKNGRKKRG